MKVFIINLEAESQRRDFQTAQLQEQGFDVDFVPAIPATSLLPEDRAAYWNSWERPLRLTGRACLLSHLKVWRRIAQMNEPALVLEDDALLAAGTREILARIRQVPGVDHVSLETRGRKKLVSRRWIELAPGVRLRRLYQDRSGAAAYVLFPSGARKLIRAAERRAGLADALLCAAKGLRSCQVEPAAAIQLDQCEALGIAVPIETSSAIDREPRPATKTRAQAARRLFAQLRMLVRHIQVLGRAERLVPSFSPNFLSAHRSLLVPQGFARSLPSSTAESDKSDKGAFRQSTPSGISTCAPSSAALPVPAFKENSRCD